jgi:hypothetical protein
MIGRKGVAFVVIAFTLALGQTMVAGQRRNQDREQEQAQAQQTIGPLAANQPELDAFLALQKETVQASRLTLADAFLAKYPTSELSGFVQRMRMDALSKQGKYKEAIAAGELGLGFEIKFMENMIAKADAEAAAAKNNNNRNRDKNAPLPIDKNSEAFKKFAEATENAMMYYYQNIMNAYQQLNDGAKVVEYGEKALGQNPEDLFTLITVSTVMAERPPADAKALDSHLKRAEELSKKALAKVNAMQADPAQKAGILNSAHQTMGLIYLHQKKYGDSQKEYTAAVAVKKDDAISYLRLGIAYAQDQKVDEALDALAKSVFLKGVTESQAREALTNVYQVKNKSLDGMDQFIQNAGRKIGL